MNFSKNINFNKYFYFKSEKLLYFLYFFCFTFIFISFVDSIFYAPIDYQQKGAFRIIYVHVPSAFMSIFIYCVMSLMSFIYLVWKIELASIIAYSSSFIGLQFTFSALITGSFWGKPMWGTWWVWDARLTSELILLFLYIGYICLKFSISNKSIANKSCSILNLMGIVNIPVIHFSVVWWNTLHQKTTFLNLSPGINFRMSFPLILSLIGFFLFYVLTVILITRNEILLYEKNSKWVKDEVRRYYDE